MKLLMINLTRMGDVIQTFPAINSWKKKGCEIHYLALDAFKTILKQCVNIDKIIAIPDKKILPDLPNHWERSYSELNHVLLELKKENYDIIISPIASTQSALLANIIPGKQKFGIIFNENREKVFTTEWSAYHLANEHHLGDHSFNLVDIFSGISQVETTPEDFFLDFGKEDCEYRDRLWEQYDCDKSFIIGFHIGASQSNKAWESYKFKEVIQRLLEDSRNIVILFGSYAERALKEVFNNINSKNFINLIEKTNLSKLTAIMHSIDLFVTNDTGPMHIATAAKRKIINISLGPVSHWETSPYLEDSIVIKAKIDCHPCAFSHVCDHLNCHNYVTPNSVLKVIDAVRNNEKVEDADSIEFWRSTKDPFLKIHNLPFAKRSITKHEFFFEGKRLAWANNIIPSKNLTVKEYLGYLETGYYLEKYDYENDLKKLNAIISVLDNYITALRYLSNYAWKKNANPNIIKLEWSQAKQMKIDLFELGKEYNKIYDLFLFAKFCESSLEQGDLVILLKLTIDIYETLKRQLMTIISFLEY